MASTPVPRPSLVVLIGPPASGKSTWAADQFDARQVVCADTLRGIVGEHELDLAASDDAFDLLDRIVDLRLGRGLTTVVDTTGLDPIRRRGYVERARAAGVPAVAVRFTTSAAECRRRNRERPHPVSVRALDAMIKKARAVDLSDEGWDLVVEPDPASAERSERAASPTHRSAPTPAAGHQRASGLRFGLLVSGFDWAGGTEAIAPTLSRIAADAEEAGFESLWVMDHLIQIPQVGARWDPMLESYSTLAYVAAATSRIRLGVLVTAVTLRNLGHLAKLVATLDVLSGGRAILGLGAGNSEHEHRAYGIDFPPVADRLALLEDALRALPVLLGPGGPPFEGRVVMIPEAVGYPRPIQDRVPIIVGGSGERVTLRLAARHADGCNLFGDPATVARKVEVLRRHCAEAGRDPADVEVTHLGSVVAGRDPADLRARVERLRPSNVGPERFARRTNAGTVDHLEARFRALAESGVRTAIISPPGLDEPGVFGALAELLERFERA